MAAPFLSEIRLFAFNFAPRNWAVCAGQLLPINQNQALFALLGTTYGGDGRVTFGLPDLRGRGAMSYGQGPGLAARSLGEKAGVETVTLALAEVPAHIHTLDVSPLTGTLPCTTTVANQRGPAGNVAAMEASGVTSAYSSAAPDATGDVSAIVPALTAAAVGAGVPHDNVQPYLVLTYCIALTGIFPSQN